MKEFIPILIIIIFSFVLSGIIVLASYVLSIKRGYTEKISVYECGFDPFGDSRQKFEVRFFLVGIIFIIFDLEISFLFPWSLILSQLTIFGYWTMILFLFILTIGLIYEYLKGGLEWE